MVMLMSVDVLVYDFVHVLDYFLICVILLGAECVLFKDAFGFFLFIQRNNLNCRGPPIFKNFELKIFEDWRK